MKKTVISIMCFILIIVLNFSSCQSDEVKTAISAFEQVVAEVEIKNASLDSEIEAAKMIITAKETCYDDTLYPMLETAIAEAEAEKCSIPKQPHKIEEILSVTETLKSVNYDIVLANLTEHRVAVERSIQRYKLVHAPEESYIINSLKKVPNIVEISAVTEETDPMKNLNKPGWYTSHVYFSCTMVNPEDTVGNTLIEKGTDAGGSIEVYRTAEEAIKREAYLASFDGSVLTSGSHVVVGTCVVRTSDALTATQQKNLEADIIEILTLLPDEECVFVQTPITNVNTPSDTAEPDTIVPSDNTDSKNQQAVKSAEEIADIYATVYPNMVKKLLVNDYGYTETQAIYAIKYANIDWNFYAVIHAEEYVDLNEGRVTRENVEWHLSVEKGYSQDAIDYAFKNADIDWDSLGNQNLLAIKKANELAATYTSVSRLFIRDWLTDVEGYDYDVAEYAVNNSDIDWSNQAVCYADEVAEWYSPQSLRDDLAFREFTEDEIEYALEMCSVDWNALAISYANQLDGYSRDDIINSLLCDGFTEEQAIYAADNCDVDYFE